MSVASATKTGLALRRAAAPSVLSFLLWHNPKKKLRQLHRPNLPPKFRRMSALKNKTPQLSPQEFQAQYGKKTSTAKNSLAGLKTTSLPPTPPSWATGRGQADASRGPRPTWAAKVSEHDCFVGIDPGVHTGVAITDHRAGYLLQLHTLDFWATTELLLQLFDQHAERLLVVIEDPNVHKSLYADKDKIKGEARVRLGQNVGANKREASLLIAYCQRKGIRVEPTRPLGKIKAEAFELQTGIKHGSQHARDAARLILGR